MTNKPLGPNELQLRGISRVTPASVVPSKPMATPLGLNVSMAREVAPHLWQPVGKARANAPGKAKGASKRRTDPKAPPA